MRDEQIERLEKQIASMNESKQLSKEMADERLRELSVLADKLRALNNPVSPTALGQLPKVLKEILGDHKSGVIVADSEGKVLLFNGTAQRVLGLDEVSDVNKNATKNFFLDDKVTALPSDFLAWEEFQDEVCHKLFFLHPRVPEGIWIQIQCAAMLDENNSQGGVVALINDITEHVKIENEIQRLCDSLETQIAVIEGARIELNQLATKLGKPDWSETIAAAANAEMSISRDHEQEVAPPDPEDSELNTLLVVDDVPVNRKLLCGQLAKLGFKFDTAENGQEAVKMVQEKRYGLVLMDLDMPIMDGLQATGEIRKYDHDSESHTPIIAMTSYTRDGDRERCLTAGMDDYLHKGVSREQLQEVIRRCIRKKKVPAPKPVPPANNSIIDTIDMGYLRVTYGISEAEEIVNLFGRTVRTSMNCLSFALAEHELKDVYHFVYTLKGPCSTLRLDSMVNLLMSIVSAADSSDWDTATHGLQSLEAHYRKVREQLLCECDALEMSL